MYPRELGHEQSGLRWGPFTVRIPFYHIRVEWPELLQGLVVGSVTGTGCIPILTGYFGLTFEMAVAFLILQSVLIYSATILFGEPLLPGWITPALPLVLALLESSSGLPKDRFQTMTALGITFAVVMGVLGISGLGSFIVERLPRALKAGILLGAGLAAYKRVFMDDSLRFFGGIPVSTTIAIALSLVVTFSVQLRAWAHGKMWIAPMVRYGLLPGFVGAGIIGPLLGEFSYHFDTHTAFSFPPFGELFHTVSPFAIGWPSWEEYVAALPLALMTYTILFSDMVTGNEILRSAQHFRPDEKIPINVTRTHLSVAVRNLLSALLCPLFSTQGCLWTGAHVIVVERWKQGRQEMESLFGGLISYCVFGIPLLYFVTPLVLAFKPLTLPALVMTLVLTGYACTSLALSIPASSAERGTSVLVAIFIVAFPAWIALPLGVLGVIALGGWEKKPQGGDMEK